MQLVYKFNYYKNFSRLYNLCKISKNLYNQGNYLIKQELDKNHKLLRYNALDKLLKETNNLENEINYRLLKAQTSQQIIKTIDKNWKTSIKLGNKNNQTFVQIPHARFIKKLTYKCKMNGITLIETEESYTSKIDRLVLEEMKEHIEYLGKRIKRGMFQSSSGKLINSDVNGSLGILRKFWQSQNKNSGESNKNVVDNYQLNEIINRGNLLTPFKIRDIYNIQTLDKVI